MICVCSSSHSFFCQKQAFCCSFAFSSSLWINSKPISSAVGRRRCVIATAQSWEHPLWSLFKAYDDITAQRLCEYEWCTRLHVRVVLVFYCSILSSSVVFVSGHGNSILFLSKFPLSYWGQKPKKKYKECFHSALNNDTQKMW